MKMCDQLLIASKCNLPKLFPIKLMRRYFYFRGLSRTDAKEANQRLTQYITEQHHEA